MEGACRIAERRLTRRAIASRRHARVRLDALLTRGERRMRERSRSPDAA
jgi:hypothetical protein